jgi:hypothetical protein
VEQDKDLFKKRRLSKVSYILRVQDNSIELREWD